MKTYTKILTIIFSVVLFFLVPQVVLKVWLGAPSSNSIDTNLRDALNNKITEVLLLGSSKTKSHYNTQIISDSLQLDVYNASFNSTDFIFTEMVFNSFTDRCTPKIVVQDVAVSRYPDSWKKIYDATPYYGTSEHVRFAFSNYNLPITERILLNLPSYLANGLPSKIIESYYRGESPSDGFEPREFLEVEPDYNEVDQGIRCYWKEQMEALRRISQKCKDKGILYVLCFSPTIDYGDTPLVNDIKAFSDLNDVVFISYYKMEYYYQHPELFWNSNHLNAKGADVFSCDFASKLKTYYQQYKND